MMGDRFMSGSIVAGRPRRHRHAVGRSRPEKRHRVEVPQTT
jgi:hypothetical protein